MKNISVIAIVAALVASPAAADTLCAEQGRWGWKITGPDFSANYTNHAANTAIGTIIGDGNCQSGWEMVTEIDPRNDTSSKVVYEPVVVGTRTYYDTKKVFDGRVTSAYTGEAPSVLKGRRNGAADKWKLVEADGNGGGTYRVTKPGNTSRTKGTKLHFTRDMLIARDNKSGTATTDPYWHRNFRYDQYKDVTTTREGDVMGVQPRRTTRVKCPSVVSWAFVSPAGDVVAVTQGKVAECQIVKQ